MESTHIFSRLVIILLFISSRSYSFEDMYYGASYKEEKSPSTYLSIDAFNEKNGHHSGFGVSASQSWTNAGYKVSGLFYKGLNDDNEDDVFKGVSLLGFTHLGTFIDPYVGLGVFFGESESCHYFAANEEVCESDYTLAVYPEVGVSVNIWRIQIAPYARRYFDTDSGVSNMNAYGVSLGFKI